MAPDIAADDPIQRAIAERVGQLPVIEDAVRADADDAVHQMRVTVRRIRSLLRACGSGRDAATGMVGQLSRSDIDAELRWLAGVLGTARDAEVLAQRYRRALDHLAPELVRGQVVERLVGSAEEQYRLGWAQSVAALDSPRYRHLLADLDALANTPAVGVDADEPPSGSTAVREAYRRVRKAAKKLAAPDAGADSCEQDDVLHGVRKAAKRLRYTASAMGAAAVDRQAKAIQSLLGEYQDSAVSRERLLTATREATAAGEDISTYELLYQQECVIARDCRGQLDRALAELADSMEVVRGGRAGL